MFSCTNLGTKSNSVENGLTSVKSQPQHKWEQLHYAANCFKRHTFNPVIELKEFHKKEFLTQKSVFHGEILFEKVETSVNSIYQQVHLLLTVSVGCL